MLPGYSTLYAKSVKMTSTEKEPLSTKSPAVMKKVRLTCSACAQENTGDAAVGAADSHMDYILAMLGPSIIHCRAMTVHGSTAAVHAALTIEQVGIAGRRLPIQLEDVEQVIVLPMDVPADSQVLAVRDVNVHQAGQRFQARSCLPTAAASER